MAGSRWRIWVGRQRRRYARFDEIIAITGSVGKTSTTAMVGALMRSRGPTLLGQDFNGYASIVLNIFRSWGPKKYWVQEVSGDAPGKILQAAEFLRPTVTVITAIGADHIDAFTTLDEIAADKGQLVAARPDTGLAVLNADDPRVLAMRSLCHCPVITYGHSPEADIRVLGWREGLPGRLQVTIADADQTRDIQTRLVGQRWITSLLASIALGRGLGISLDECTRVIGEMEPVLNRDSVHTLPDGTTIVLDTHKRAYWTIPGCIEIVQKASASRKTMIFSAIGYYQGSESRMYRNIATMALASADRVIILTRPDIKLPDFATELANAYPERFFHFTEISQVNNLLRQSALPGELIYLKAAIAAHLERLWYERVEPIKCWVDFCEKSKNCDTCRNLYGGIGKRVQADGNLK